MDTPLDIPDTNEEQHIIVVLQAPPSAVPTDANATASDPPVTRVAFFRLHEDNETFVWMQVDSY